MVTLEELPAVSDRTLLVMRIKRTLAWGALVLGLLLAAWAVPNLIDRDSEARPAELALPAEDVDEDDRMFMHLMGLNASDAADPVEAGRQEWVRMLAAAPSAAQHGLGSLEAPAAGTVARPQGPPWACQNEADCPSQWRAEAAALGDQLEKFSALGKRCEAANQLGPFVERIPPMRLALPPGLHTSGAQLCARWFAAQAVLAAVAGQAPAALQALTQSDQLVRSVLAGSRSPVGQKVALGSLRRHWQTLATVAQVQPAWVPQLLPFAQPLAPEVLDARPAVRIEAAFQQAILDDLQQRCDAVRSGQADSFGFTELLRCRFGLGFLPQTTRQELDEDWLALLQATDADPVASLARLDELPTDDTGALRLWRNSFARSMFPSTGRHQLLREQLQALADAELHRRTLELALRLRSSGTPMSQAAAWLAAQPLPAGLRERIETAPDGQALFARRWSTGSPYALSMAPIAVSLAPLTQ